VAERGWIPVVTNFALDVTAPAYMEETLAVDLTVTAITKALLWSAGLVFSVTRPEGRVEVAQASITHGYALVRGAEAGTMATFDDAVLAALGG